MIAWTLLDWAVVGAYGFVAGVGALLATVLVWELLTRKPEDQDQAE